MHSGAYIQHLPVKELLNQTTGQRFTHTKIVCTLGPKSFDAAVLDKMMEAGMDICRLNFSHGDYAFHQKLYDTVRAVAAKHDNQVSIVCDIQGPKIRTGTINGEFQLKEGDVIRVTPDKIVGDSKRIQIVYDEMLKDLGPNDVIYINDGIVKLMIKEKDLEHRDLVCVCTAGGSVSSKKGCNIPSGNLSCDVLTPKDKADLEFICKLNPEWVAVSFVKNAEDVHIVRKFLKDHGNDKIKIISKIERPSAIECIDAIIDASDGLMVARGDMGVEIPAHKVPQVQKLMIRKSNLKGKPVICATQMLESMVKNSRPTRAEAADVFNAVLDGADAVMLSAETATGEYPVLTIRYMDQICEAAEQVLPRPLANIKDFESPSPMHSAMGHSVLAMVDELERFKLPAKIICLSYTGDTMRHISKYRPSVDMIGISSNQRTAMEMNLVWGVKSLYSPEPLGDDVETMSTNTLKAALKKGMIAKNDYVIIVTRTKKIPTTSIAGFHVGLYHAADYQ